MKYINHADSMNMLSILLVKMNFKPSWNTFSLDRLSFNTSLSPSGAERGLVSSGSETLIYSSLSGGSIRGSGGLECKICDKILYAASCVQLQCNVLVKVVEVMKQPSLQTKYST